MKMFFDEYGTLIVECIGGAIILAAIILGFIEIAEVISKFAAYAAG